MSGFKALGIGYYGIRSRLILLALIAAVPFIWYRIADIRAGETENIASIREEAMRAASRGAEEQSEVFGDIRTLLSVIAKVPALTSGAADECSSFLASVKDTRTWAKSLMVTGPDGNVLCSSEHDTPRMTLGEETYFRRAASTHEFAVSDFIYRAGDDQPTLVAAYPTYTAAGRLERMLVATMKLLLFDQEAADVGRALSARVLLLDASGRILTGYPNVDAAHPGAADLAIADGARNNTAGWLESKDADGVRRVYGIASLPGTDARLATGFSIEDALADTRVKMRAAYINAASIGAAIILLAWLAGEIYVLKPLRSLIETTRQLTDGNLAARADHGNSATEFRELAASFNTMADRLAMLATSDSLTGLANRRRFEQYLHEEWRRALRAGTPMALALIDIDGFKLFNDIHGHQIGDQCLRLVASELARFARRSEDLLGRYGGEEFIVGLPGLAEPDAYRHCERMRSAIAALAFPDLKLPSGSITISVGVAVCTPVPGSSPEQLIAMADAALYDAKRGGRDRVALYRDGPVPSTIKVA